MGGRTTAARGELFGSPRVKAQPRMHDPNLRTLRILLLEDDLETVAILTQRISELESEIKENGLDISLIVLSEYTMVEKYINQDEQHQYDIILLDHDCKAGGSFHTIFTKADPTKIISISLIAEWSEQAERKGVTRIISKDFLDQSRFADTVIINIREMIHTEVNKKPMVHFL
jgi:CheY-like chemotaxis protein